MSTILSADWHLSSREADEYRWQIFDWLAEQKADELIINGDLSDQKDRHDAKFVNRLFDAVYGLENKFRVIINMGNHDALDPDHPFFAFLGTSSDIVFVTKPIQLRLSIGSALFVPAFTKWDFKIPKVDYLFTHATWSGSKAENGTTLTGVDPAVLDGFNGHVLSGDIHVPQRLRDGQIEYCGSPYHVRFGDSFKPRVMWIGNDGRTKDLFFPAPHKLVLIITKPDQLEDESAEEDDHVKVRVLLNRSDLSKWRDYQKEIRTIAESRGWKLFGIEPFMLPEKLQDADDKQELTSVDVDELVKGFAIRHKANDLYIKTGLDLLKESE